MLSTRLRRRYGMPLEGPTGLTETQERLLQRLDVTYTTEEMKREVLPQIDELKHLVVRPAPLVVTPAAPQPVPVAIKKARVVDEKSVRAKYALPATGYATLTMPRLLQLVRWERWIARYHNNPRFATMLRSIQRQIRGMIAEQRFVASWTHNGFQQPGVLKVRPGSESEDHQQIDAVMELINGHQWYFQISTCAASKTPTTIAYLRTRGIVFVEVDPESPPEKIRADAIIAMQNLLVSKHAMNVAVA